MPHRSPYTRILLTAILLFGLTGAAQADVTVKIHPDGLELQTKAEFETLTLVITGPDAICQERVFEPGSSLFYPLEEARIEWLDGSYSYEIRMTRKLTSAEIERLGKLRAEGKTIGEGPTAWGNFSILEGRILLDQIEKVPTKDFLINDDLIVDGSACIGFDCVNGESFSFDTIRLKENNLRIKFDDTSVAASFPRTDWQLTANDSANGGASKFSIDDISGNRTPFTVEANAPSHSLYVDDGGRIGIRTSTPVAEIHIIDGDTPTVRLEQNGSSGFQPQTWDVAGNETSFFIRDASNGSTLPFRIRPGAPSQQLVVDTDGVGVGLLNPTAPLHVLKNGSGTIQLFRLESDAQPRFTMVNNGGDRTWHVQVTTSNDAMAWIDAGPAGMAGNGEAMRLEPNGDLEIQGTLTANNGMDTFPDYVFEDDYPLMPLDELEAFIKENKHLPNIPDAKTVEKEGLNMTEMQVKLVEKVEELTLYTIDLQKTIAEQQALMAEMQTRMEQLESEKTAPN